MVHTVAVRFFLVAALVVGFLGPCVCTPLAAAPDPAEHVCCGTAAGWKPAPADCCPACSTLLRSQDSALPREAPPTVCLAPTSGLPQPLRHRIPPPPPSSLRALVVLPPPNILRV